MNIFLDANILIDLITNRCGDAQELKEYLGEIPKETVYISALSIHIVFYVLKLKSSSKLFPKIKLFLSEYNVIGVDEIVINQALTYIQNDLEDAIQFFCATKHCDIIFTKDQKEFRKLKDLVNSNIKLLSNID